MADKKQKTLDLNELAKAVSTAAKLAAERRGIKVGTSVHFRDGFVGVEISDATATTQQIASLAADVVGSISKGPARPLGPLTPAAQIIRIRTWAGGMWGPIPDSWLKHDIILRVP